MCLVHVTPPKALFPTMPKKTLGEDTAMVVFPNHKDRLHYNLYVAVVWFCLFYILLCGRGGVGMCKQACQCDGWHCSCLAGSGYWVHTRGGCILTRCVVYQCGGDDNHDTVPIFKTLYKLV